MKLSTIAHLKRARQNLVDILGSKKLLAEVSVGYAKRFREQLAESQAPYTVRRICGRAKQFFQAAVDDGKLTVSPFAKMKDTTVRANKSRDYEVTGVEAAKVIDACPDKEWRLIFALARFGGLRVPSELFALRWEDIDWTKSRVRIQSPKTGERFMPLFSELRPYLEDAFDPESEFVIVANRSKPNLRTQLTRIIKKAGLQPWPKLFQNLRASRSSELAKEYGPHVEAEWLGHSVEVAGEHYVRASRADFEKAAGNGLGEDRGAVTAGTPKTAQKTAQHGAKPAAQLKTPRNQRFLGVGAIAQLPR